MKCIRTFTRYLKSLGNPKTYDLRYEMLEKTEWDNMKWNILNETTLEETRER